MSSIPVERAALIALFTEVFQLNERNERKQPMMDRRYEFLFIEAVSALSRAPTVFEIISKYQEISELDHNGRSIVLIYSKPSTVWKGSTKVQGGAALIAIAFLRTASPYLHRPAVCVGPPAAGRDRASYWQHFVDLTDTREVLFESAAPPHSWKNG